MLTRRITFLLSAFLLFVLNAICPADSSPVSVGTIQGNYVSGALTDVVNSDDLFYVASSLPISGVGETAQIECYFNIPTFDKSVGAQVIVEAGSDSSGPTTLQVYLYDYTASAYVYIKAWPAPATGEYVFNLPLAQADLAKYMSSSGEVRVLCRGLVPSRFSPTTYNLRVDQVRFIVPVPLAPTNLTAVAKTSSRIDLAWTDKSNNESGYFVERKTGSAGTWSQIAALPANSVAYQNTGLQETTTYTYRVRAQNSVGYSDYSNEASATTKANPPAPLSLTAVGWNAQVHLEWNAAPTATGYSVKRSTMAGGPYSTVQTGIVPTRFTDSGLANGTKYYYVVTSTNDNGESQNSNEASATPLATIPLAPQNLRAFPASYKVVLTWEPSALATSYTVKKSNVDGGPYTYIGNVTVTHLDDTYVTNGNTYYYIVTASSAAGESGPSNQAQATPTAARIPLGTRPNPPFGVLPDPLTLPSWMEHTVPTDSSGSTDGPASQFSVNLAYGVVDVDCGPDLITDDPLVGEMIFERHYRTVLASANLSSPGLPPGWTHNYDLHIVSLQTDGTYGPMALLYPNGASETLTPVLVSGVPTGAFTVPAGAPYTADGVVSSAGTGLWTSLTLHQNGRAQQVFTMDAGDDVYRLHTAVSEGGTQLNLRYSNKRLIEVRSYMYGSSKSGALTFQYDGTSGLLQSAQGYNTTINLLYKDGQLTSVTNPDTATGHLWDYEYTTLGGAAYLNKAWCNNNVATLNYDIQTGRAASLVDANSNTRTYTYSGTGHTVVSVAKNGTVADQHSTDADSLGRTVGVSDAAGHQTTITYASSAPGSIDTVVSPLGNRVVALRDSHGNPTRLTEPWGNYTQVTWEYPTDAQFGRITSEQEFGNDGSSKSPTTYTYYGPTASANGAFPSKLATVTHPNGCVETYTYTSLGSVLAVASTAANGTAISTQFDYMQVPYDAQSNQELIGKPYKITDPNNHVTQLGYDGYRLYNVVDPSGLSVSSSYNHNYQLTSIYTSIVGGPQLTIHYSNPGSPASSTSITGASGNSTANYTGNFNYDSEYALTYSQGITDTVANSLTLDPTYSLSKVVNGNGKAMHTFSLDPFNSTGQTAIGDSASPGQYTSTSYFDAEGSLIEQHGPMSIATMDYIRTLPNTMYIAANSASSGMVDVLIEHNYDAFGRLSDITNGPYSHTYAYDSEDHVVRDTCNWSQLDYAYAPNGARTSMKLAVGGTTLTYIYGYDKAGNLTSISVNDQNGVPIPGVSASYTYDANDRVIAVRTPQATTLYTYDSLGQVISLQNLTTDNFVDDTAQVITEPSGVRHSPYSGFSGMTYDPLGNRLGMNFTLRGKIGNSTADYVNGSASWGFSPNLNGETWNVGGQTLTYSYDLDNAKNLISIRGHALPVDQGSDQLKPTLSTWSDYSATQYNADGDLTSFRGITATYDAASQLRTTVTSSGTTNSSSYDSLGLRLSRQNETFVYDGTSMVFHGSGSYGNGVFYLWGPTGPVMEYTPDSQFAMTYLFDPSGNVINRVGSASNGQGWRYMAEPQLYDAYGEQIFVRSGYFTPGPGIPAFWNGQAFRYKGQFGYYTDTDTDLVYCQNRYYDPRAGRWLTRDPIGLEGGVNTYAYCDGNPLMLVDPSGLQDMAIGFASIKEKTSHVNNLTTIGGDLTGFARVSAAMYFTESSLRESRFPGSTKYFTGMARSEFEGQFLSNWTQDLRIFGHADNGMLFYGVPMNDNLQWEDVAKQAKRRQALGLPKFKSIEVYSCMVMQDRRMVNALLDMAEVVRGYEGWTVHPLDLKNLSMSGRAGIMYTYTRKFNLKDILPNDGLLRRHYKRKH